MMKLLVALFAVAAIGVNARPFEEEVFDCQGKVDGYYPDNTNPAAFFSCNDGSLIAKVVCEDGEEFDGVDGCRPIDQNEVQMREESDSSTGNLPFYPPGDNDDDDDDDDNSAINMSRKKIYNIEFTKNIFPRSILIIGRMNREQKNK